MNLRFVWNFSFLKIILCAFVTDIYEITKGSPMRYHFFQSRSYCRTEFFELENIEGSLATLTPTLQLFRPYWKLIYRSGPKCGCEWLPENDAVMRLPTELENFCKLMGFFVVIQEGLFVSYCTIVFWCACCDVLYSYFNFLSVYWTKIFCSFCIMSNGMLKFLKHSVKFSVSYSTPSHPDSTRRPVSYKKAFSSLAKSMPSTPTRLDSTPSSAKPNGWSSTNIQANCSLSLLAGSTRPSTSNPR